MPQAVSTQAAPAAIGPYSQAVRAGDFLFVSGQIPLDPATGTLVDADVRAQTRRVLENLSAIVSGRRGVTRPCREDDGLPRRHERLPGDE